MTNEQITARLKSQNGEGYLAWVAFHPAHGKFPMGRTLAEAIEVARTCKWFDRAVVIAR